MKNLLQKALILILCVTAWTSQCQIKEHKDLNSDERVAALYKINEQRKFYRDKYADCVKKFNDEQKANIRAIDSLTAIAKKMGDRSDEYVDHNLDLQAGLLGLIDQGNKKDVEIATLKASKTKQFGIGVQGGYNFFTGQPYGGVGVSWNPFRF